MRILLAIPSMGKGPLNQCLDQATSTVDEWSEILVWANGTHLNFEDAYGTLTVGGSEKNIGVTPALHKLYEMALASKVEDDDWVLFLHDDTIILEQWWSGKVEKWLSERPNAVLFGFGGARGLGDPDIYQKPYELIQLARRDFISNMKNAELHGRRVTEPTRVATLDLFSIGAKVSFLKELGGWNWWPEVHHSMDNAICLEAKRRGGEVWMFPIECDHLGGQTSTKTDFQKDFGEAEGRIHARGHEILYERYRDVLPVWEE